MTGRYSAESGDDSGYFANQKIEEVRRLADEKKQIRESTIADAAKAASEAADEWWKLLQARDRGENVPDTEPLPDYMIAAILRLSK